MLNNTLDFEEVFHVVLFFIHSWFYNKETVNNNNKQHGNTQP